MFKFACVHPGLVLSLKKFGQKEDGTATIFACFMIMMMLLVGGIGVDLMHNEMKRTRLQNTLDRSVLAAADRDQKLSPEDVVRDHFDKAGMTEYLTSVTVSEGQNSREVYARASTYSETQFMRMVGVDQLRVPAASTAKDSFSNVEISLVLDISGSMGQPGRLENMRKAAIEFKDLMIRPETENLISLSLIPYSEHVNAGRALFEALPRKNWRHNYSYCIEFPDADFQTTQLSDAHAYDQMQHFQWFFSNSNQVDNTSCPSRAYEEITPFSQNTNALEAQIQSLQPRAQTSVYLGVKWAAALLDPSTRNIIDTMIINGDVDNAFSGRPADFSDPDTLKTIVVMTDGRNTESYRIADWAYNSASEYVHWKNHNFWHYLERYVYSNHHEYYFSEKYSSANGDIFLDQICQAAKQQGIVIWSVGFEVDDHGAGVLENCASSPSHFFRVEGVDISKAFKAIASQINQLRLTQ